jgi:hypothetical protein
MLFCNQEWEKQTLNKGVVMKNKIIKIEELKAFGFNCDTSVATIVFDNQDEILDYFSNDQEAIEEIERMQETSDVVLELIADIDENGIATQFSYGFGRNIGSILACNEDDLGGVIEWLRK